MTVVLFLFYTVLNLLENWGWDHLIVAPIMYLKNRCNLSVGCIFWCWVRIITAPVLDLQRASQSLQRVWTLIKILEFFHFILANKHLHSIKKRIDACRKKTSDTCLIPRRSPDWQTNASERRPDSEMWNNESCLEWLHTPNFWKWVDVELPSLCILFVIGDSWCYSSTHMSSCLDSTHRRMRCLESFSSSQEYRGGGLLEYK